MPDDLLPAELVLPEGADPPFTDELLDEVAEGGTLNEPPVLATVPDAEYTMASLARVQAHLDEAKLQRNAWVRRIDEWHEHATRGLHHRARFLNDLLEAWGVHERLAHPKVATLPLPSGVVETRQGKEPTVVLVDEAAVVKWAADALDGDTYELVVKTTAEVRISELRKIVTVEDLPDPDAPPDADLVSVLAAVHKGERVPGVDVEPPATTAKARPAMPRA